MVYWPAETSMSSSSKVTMCLDVVRLSCVKIVVWIGRLQRGKGDYIEIEWYRQEREHTMQFDLKRCEAESDQSSEHAEEKRKRHALLRSEIFPKEYLRKSEEILTEAM